MQAANDIRDFCLSRRLGDVYKRQASVTVEDQDKQVLSIPSSLDINLSTGNSVPASNNAILNFMAGASATDNVCLLSTTDAADELRCVVVGG